MISFRETVITAGIIAVVCLFVYGGSLRNNFVQFDDNTLITSNPAVVHVSLSSVKHVFTSYDPELYIPLTLLTYQLQRLLFGFNPFVFHLTNLLIHVMNAVLVFLLLFHLFGRRWISCAGGILFAIHPLHAEAVAWATGLKDVLATFFGLVSLLLYEYAHERTSRRVLIASIILFFLGLLSKAVLIPLPFALLLFDWLQRRPITKQFFLEKIPYAFLSIVFVIIALFGKQELIVETTLLQKILMAMKSTVFYLEKFFAPVHLTVIYPYTHAIKLTSPDFFVPFLVVIAISAIALFSVFKMRIILFSWLFFLTFLVPTFVNFSKGGALYFASDRYAYIPSIGIIIFLAWCCASLTEHFSMHRFFPWMQRCCIGVGIVLAVVLGLMTQAQSRIWKDSETLFTQVLSLYPNALLARNNLANIYRDQGNLDAALAQYEAALAVNPRHAVVWNNIGIIFRSLGRIDDAIAAYEKAVSFKPDFADAPYNRGYLEYKRGKLPDALVWYKKALAIAPQHIRARIGASVVLSEQGNDGDAMKLLAEGALLQPDIADFPFNLGVLLERNGKRNEARAMYKKAITLNPYNLPALHNLGAMALEDQDVSAARTYFRRALSVDPNDPDAQYNLRMLENTEVQERL